MHNILARVPLPFNNPETWKTIVKRESDGKYFMWFCDKDEHDRYVMCYGYNYMEEVFPLTIYK